MEDRAFLYSRSPSFYIPPVPLTLTPADTDQVASSLWVSMEPANRKQVRPGMPTLVPNVAVKDTELCFDRVKQHQLKLRYKLLPALGLECKRVLCLHRRRGWKKLSGLRVLEVISPADRSTLGASVCIKARRADSPLHKASQLLTVSDELSFLSLYSFH